jgi:diguanylate cyclase (GGDEF)-like protein
MLRVSAQRGAPTAQTLRAVEPSARFAAGVASGIFACETLILLAATLLPRDGFELRVELWAVPTVSAVIALALYLRADHVGPRAPQAAAALGTVLVSAHVQLAGGEGVVASEMLYVWLAMYAAYFFSTRGAALQLAFMCAAYLAVLLLSDPRPAVAGSWITFVGTVLPAAVLVSLVRDAVTGMVARLSEAAQRDPLTGLRNRLALAQGVEVEIDRALRTGGRLSVAIGDLDHFKAVNDQLGHRAGDDALVRAATILERQGRTVDTVARTGGEEFTILLPGSTDHEAYLIAERLRSAVEHEFGKQRVPLTFSFGVATYPDHGRSAEAVLEAADQALYAAKALGRNRSVIFSREVAAIFAPAAGRGVDEVQLATLLSLAEALDLRDTGTADHARTVGRYCSLIAEELGLPEERVRRVEVAGILHDVGKVGLPEAILQKKGPLAKSEKAEIRTHPEIGGQILSGRGLEDLRDWVMAHHERPDGSGYPKGLRGEEIPLEAKILAVADAYEAMTADRVYRSAMSVKAARGELLRCARTQFDSRVVAAFMAVLTRLDSEREAGVARAG